MSRLDQTLKALDGPVSCELGLADGRQFSLGGAFTEPGCAQGVLLSGERARRAGERDEEEDHPGSIRDVILVDRPVARELRHDQRRHRGREDGARGQQRSDSQPHARTQVNAHRYDAGKGPEHLPTVPRIRGTTAV